MVKTNSLKQNNVIRVERKVYEPLRQMSINQVLATPPFHRIRVRRPPRVIRYSYSAVLLSFSVQPVEGPVAVERAHSDVRTLEKRPSVAQGGTHIRQGRGRDLVKARNRPASSKCASTLVCILLILLLLRVLLNIC